MKRIYNSISKSEVETILKSCAMAVGMISDSNLPAYDMNIELDSCFDLMANAQSQGHELVYYIALREHGCEGGTYLDLVKESLSHFATKASMWFTIESRGKKCTLIVGQEI